MLALTPADFDFTKETVSVKKSYQRLKCEDVITAPKTTKSIRTVKMPKFLSEEIDDTGIGALDGEIATAAFDEYIKNFQERNPNLYLFSAHLHLDEATPHLHCDFVPFITGSKRGLDTRVSLKAALAAQGFIGASRQETEWNKWVLAEKEELSRVMQRHSIEWEKLGTKDEHLSVLSYKKEQCAKEVAGLEKEYDKVAKRLATIEKHEDLVGISVRHYNEDPEWQLPEPTIGMTVKAYKAINDIINLRRYGMIVKKRKAKSYIFLLAVLFCTSVLCSCNGTTLKSESLIVEDPQKSEVADSVKQEISEVASGFNISGKYTCYNLYYYDEYARKKNLDTIPCITFFDDGKCIFSEGYIGEAKGNYDIDGNLINVVLNDFEDTYFYNYIYGNIGADFYMPIQYTFRIASDDEIIIDKDFYVIHVGDSFFRREIIQKEFNNYSEAYLSILKDNFTVLTNDWIGGGMIAIIDVFGDETPELMIIYKATERSLNLKIFTFSGMEGLESVFDSRVFTAAGGGDCFCIYLTQNEELMLYHSTSGVEGSYGFWPVIPNNCLEILDDDGGAYNYSRDLAQLYFTSWYENRIMYYQNGTEISEGQFNKSSKDIMSNIGRVIFQSSTIGMDGYDPYVRDDLWNGITPYVADYMSYGEAISWLEEKIPDN